MFGRILLQAVISNMLDYQGANQQPQDKPDWLGLTMAFAHPEFLVATDWLAERLADDDVRVFETTVFLHPRDGGGRRNESGRMEYESGQIPGAGFLDLRADFSDNGQPWRFMMPRPAHLPRRRDGTASRSRQNWSSTTAWGRSGRRGCGGMFRSMGCEGVAVLDGGWRCWTAEGRAVSTDPATYAPTTFTPTADPARFADLVEVKAYIESGDGGGSCLINALGREQHSGADGGITYGRAGHIPGAPNVPSGELTDSETGLYRPAEEPALLFQQAGADRTQRVITYYGGGIAASNDAFILAMLG